MSRAAFTGWIRHPPDDRDLTRTMGPPLLSLNSKYLTQVLRFKAITSA
jgi:hypothetical protein